MACATIACPRTGPLGTDGIPHRLSDRGLAWQKSIKRGAQIIETPWRAVILNKGQKILHGGHGNTARPRKTVEPVQGSKFPQADLINAGPVAKGCKMGGCEDLRARAGVISRLSHASILPKGPDRAPRA